MELIRGQHNMGARHYGCAATIGNFDGVHLGHQAILRQLAVAAKALALPATVIIFEPQPQEFFAPHKSPARLTRLREKLLALQEQDVQRVLVLKFDRRLAGMSAQAFIEALLVKKLGIRYLVMGDDFRFGRDRQGDFSLLGRYGIQYGFEVAATTSFELDGQRVSSTRVREALGRGDLAQATRLLGRSYAICGRVAHGDKRGRTLGFPTANIYLHRCVTPLSGVYAITLEGVAPRPAPGVANIGRRPTVNGVRDQLEVHLFDFDGDIYGCHVRVNFLYHLRTERRFESLDALKSQIGRDAVEARSFFAERQGVLGGR